MPDMPYKAAVIGLGFIGAGDEPSAQAIGQQVANLDGTHAQAFAEHPAVELVAGSSRDAGRRERFTRRTGVANTYADWRDMLRDEPLDIVGVATYSPYHAVITQACAEAGVRAVLCDKPIATRLADADRAIRACREHGTILVVNHQRRWRPAWCAARDAIQNGAIGNIRYTVAHWPTGRLGNVGTHVFDAVNMVLRASPIAVSASLDATVPPDCRGDAFYDPGGWGVVQYDNDTRAFIHALHQADLPMQVRVVGSDGEMTIYNDTVTIAPWRGSPHALSLEPMQCSAMALAVDDIVTALRDGSPPTSSGVDALAALEIIVGFHASHDRQAQWISLPLTGEQRQREIAIG